MVVDDILKVLYAPHKAFKRIVKEPKYLGPIILLVIFVVAQFGPSYGEFSKSYVEQTMPVAGAGIGEGDVWTENAALWHTSSEVTASNNTVDFINSTYLGDFSVGAYYGNVSIDFSASNVSIVWMELTDFEGSVNCGVDGFKNVSFRVKIVTPDAEPERITLYLHSLGGSNFSYDLTSEFSNSVVDVWNNMTIPVGPESGWTSNGATAAWENVTGIRMEFEWLTNQNISLRVDGLFFRGKFLTLLELSGTSFITYGALNAITPFLLQWLVLTGLLYVMIKVLKGSVVWKPLFIAVGFALVTMVVQTLVVGIAYTTLPDVYYPLEVLSRVFGEFTAASQVISDSIAPFIQIIGYIQLATYAWIVGLGAAITREITAQPVEGATAGPQFGWGKSLLVSGASVVLRFLILVILGI